MTKLITVENCWISWLACMTDQPLDSFKECSTKFDDWREKTDQKLATLGLYFIEAHPGVISLLPEGQLVGAHVNGIKAPHIVIAKTLRSGPRHGFECYHDPSGRVKPGTFLNTQRIVLLC